MAIYEGERKASLSTEQDRRLWAKLDRAVFNLRVKGTGQHLSEPVYFGQAFDKPPAFNYSGVVSEIGSDYPEVKSVTRPHPDFAAAIAGINTPGDSLTSQGLLVDGSFEHQIIFGDGTIPVLNESSYQKIYDEQYGITSYPIRPGRNTNGWVQGFETNSRWVVLGDRYNPAVVPNREGRFSAKYTFDVDGDSRWLYPTRGSSDCPFWGIHSGTEDQQRFECFAHTLGISSHYDGGLGAVLGPFHNPEANRYTYVVHTWTDSPATLEFNWAGWDAEGFAGGEQDFFADDSAWGGTVRLLKEETYTSAMTAGAWQVHTFDVTWPFWPNAPIRADRANEIIQLPGWDVPTDAYATVRFRVTGGIAGQDVHIDDALAWLNVQTGPPASLLTVGIAEWIKDEQGMYVGARLWLRAESEGDALAI